MTEQAKHLAALRGFANEMIQAALDGCDMDGASIQEAAVKHGLLAIKRMPVPCRGPAEHCRCAWSTDFPADCYQQTAAMTDTDHFPDTTKMVDAAMVEMEGISPPLRRNECERLIRAALAAATLLQSRCTSPITHRPLIRNAISLLRMRRPVPPDVERVADGLEAILEGMHTPADGPSTAWLEVAAQAAPQPPQGESVTVPLSTTEEATTHRRPNPAHGAPKPKGHNPVA